MKRNFKVYDCFLYNNEDLILDIRLNTLDRYVDYFVIVESAFTHSGFRKKLNFKLEKFNKFKKKIIYIVVKKLPVKVKHFYLRKVFYHENFVREQFQRNQIMRGLKKANPNDLILISDIDEIPNLLKVDLNKINKCVVFYQRIFQLKFNLELKNANWQRTRALKYKYLKSPQDVRNTIVRRIKFWQIHRYFLNPQYVNAKKGGWHFTSILSLKDVKKKLISGGHGELDFEKFNPKVLKEKLKKKIDIFYGIKLTKTKINKSFPEYLLKNKTKFKKYIL